METFEETRRRLHQRYGRDRLPRERSLRMSADVTRDLLADTLRAANPGKGVWIRDFGDDWVVYTLEWEVGQQWKEETLRINYGHDEDFVIELKGDPTEVRQQRIFVPVRAKAFLTEANGKTLITGPAEAMPEVASAANPYFLRIQGRLVGAEKANRNGALWTTGDLEMGQPTVNNGPLNWLHESRHIIGALSESAMVLPKAETAATAIVDPYIEASSVLWSFIWPDEAAVVQQASDSSKLWYSMECISENVHCQADECGGVFSYLDVVTASEGICEHVANRTAARRFENPTFLGAAVIVPPVRPGWADADAKVVTAMAEKAFEDAGRPDVDSGEWERLMMGVLAYAGT